MRPVPDGNPSPNDIEKGDTMSGHFERIPHGDKVMPRDARRPWCRSMGAFDFVRIEDQTADPDELGVVYFAETGAAHQETSHGRIYRLEVIRQSSPRRACRWCCRAAKGDDIFNPDNLGICTKALVIQEDRNWKRKGYSRVLVYDLATEVAHPVARPDPRRT